MPEKIALINLGCPKNLVDAEVMLGHLQSEGYELTSDLETADVVVVNTCGFLQDAAQESVDTLLAAAERKKEGRLRAVVAAGCMTQRYGEDVASAMPEVDGFLGVGQGHHLPDVVRRVLGGERASVLRGPSAGFEGYGLRLQSTPSYTSYVKVSEGCDRKCAFCIIPQIRGAMVSRPVDAIVREAQVLAAQGTREVILIGQDPTRYGVDLPTPAGSHAPTHLLPELLARLNEVPELRWIRLMYLFPDRHADRVLEAVAALPKVCKYIDMPVQHASPEVLRAMNRPGSGQEYLRLLEKLRSACPDACVRSTLITGFPGETGSQFEEMMDFTRRAQLDWLGVFRYSLEEGTAAAAMEAQVPRRVSRQRYERLMGLQQEISAARGCRWLGRTVEVLVENVEGASGTGRTQGQAPEVDGETRLDLGRLPGTRPGDFVLAEVTGSGPYDLEASAVELAHRPPVRQPGLLQIGVLN
jgi:ribosomal protein S12 methylthiotransferase